MKPTLYFLRSSEQKIVTDMLYYAKRLDEADKTLADIPELSIYEEFYGFTSKDLGLYILLENRLVGAAWIRRLNADHASNGYIDDITPVLNIAVIPEFRGQGIGSTMIEQLFLESGALYDNLSVSIINDLPEVKFFERHGFVFLEGAMKKSPVDGSDVRVMVKKLVKGEVKRPTDGYDPRRWMD
jgi:ribosomal protein S18 acetylase RimI-like enzyme